MRFQTLIPLFAATTALASSSSSQPSETSPAPEPTPVGQLWTAQWKDADLTSSYTKSCESTTAHKAEIYKLSEMYPALKTWAAELKVFYHKQHYPGSWEGEDVHGEGRTLLKMELLDVPVRVREWLVFFYFIYLFLFLFFYFLVAFCPLVRVSTACHSCMEGQVPWRRLK